MLGYFMSFIKMNIYLTLSFSTWLYEAHQTLMLGYFVLPSLCLVRRTFEFPRHLLRETHRETDLEPCSHTLKES